MIQRMRAVTLETRMMISLIQSTLLNIYWKPLLRRVNNYRASFNA